MELVIGAFLGGLSLLAVSLKRTYYLIPTKELRRQSRGGDEIAEALYRAASYGYSLKLVLWTLVGLTSAAFFVFVASSSPAWFAFAASGALVWIGFV